MEYKVEFHLSNDKIREEKVKFNNTGTTTKIYELALTTYKKYKNDPRAGLLSITEFICNELSSEYCQIDVLNNCSKYVNVATKYKTKCPQNHPFVKKDRLFFTTRDRKCITILNKCFESQSVLYIPILSNTGQISIGKINQDFATNDVAKIHPFIEMIEELIKGININSSPSSLADQNEETISVEAVSEDLIIEEEEECEVNIPQAKINDIANIESDLDFTEENFIKLRQDVINLRLLVLSMVDRLRGAKIIA